MFTSSTGRGETNTCLSVNGEWRVEGGKGKGGVDDEDIVESKAEVVGNIGNAVSWYFPPWNRNIPPY